MRGNVVPIGSRSIEGGETEGVAGVFKAAVANRGTRAKYSHNRKGGKLEEKKIIKKATDRQKGVPAFPPSRDPAPPALKKPQ